jgi:hypothetical protein
MCGSFGVAEAALEGLQEEAAFLEGLKKVSTGC